MTIRPILPSLLTLIQHIQTLNLTPYEYTPKECPYCHSKKLWNHGCYTRKPDKTNEGPDNSNLNPVPIPRYLCPQKDCGRTCSTLPECLPPRRWYQWSVQEQVLRYYLEGRSTLDIEKLVKPSIMTICRWINRFIEQFEIYFFLFKNQ